MADYWSNFRQRRGKLHLNALAGGDPCEYPENTSSETSVTAVLSDAEDHTIVCSFVCAERRNVTDGRTARQTARIAITSAVFPARNADAL